MSVNDYTGELLIFSKQILTIQLNLHYIVKISEMQTYLSVKDNYFIEQQTIRRNSCQGELIFCNRFSCSQDKWYD